MLVALAVLLGAWGAFGAPAGSAIVCAPEFFAVSAPSSATAGSAFSFTVTAEGPGNCVVTGYLGTVHFTSGDGNATLPADSMLSSGSGTFSATLRSAGNQTITATDASNSLMTGTSDTILVVRPPSASIVTPTNSAVFTEGQAVDASYSCQEATGGPGLASCAGPVPNGSPIDTSTTGSHTFVVTATSLDGQSSQTTSTYAVNALTGPGRPSATITTPANGSSFTKGQLVSAGYSCAPGADGGVLKAGAAGCSGTVANGSPIDTSSTGSHTLAVTATDTDGQSTTVTSTYTVTAPLSPTLLSHTAKGVNARAKIKAACRQAVACTGKIAIFALVKPTGSKQPKRVVVAHGSYSIAAGKTATLSIPLTSNGAALLNANHGSLGCTLKLTPTGSKPTTTQLTLKTNKRKH